MKWIDAPYLLFAVIFGFMALIAPDLMEEHRLTFEGRVSMFLFQVAMEFLCALATAKHLHDKWVQKDIDERNARLRMPRPAEEPEPGPEAAAEAQSTDGSAANDQGNAPTAQDHASHTAAVQDPHGTTGR